MNKIVQKLNWDIVQPGLMPLLHKYPFTQMEIDINKKECSIFARKQIYSQDNFHKKEEKQYTEDLYYKIISSPHSNPYSEIEMSIPYKFLKNAMNDIFHMFKKKIPHIDMRILLRFSGQDKHADISMTSNRTLSAHLSLFADSTYSTSPQILNTFKMYEEMMINKYNGRPHFGKKIFINNKKMEKIYPNFNHFKKIRQKLDPTGMFINNYIEQILN